MRSTRCAFCGNESKNLLEVYPADSFEEKQAFCSLCLETDAQGISFRRDGDLNNRVVLQSLYRLMHMLLREVREVRREQAALHRELRGG